MKNYRTFKSLALAGIIAFSFTACSDDDENIVEEVRGETSSARLIATSATEGNIVEYTISDDYETTEKRLSTTGISAADGMTYDEGENVVVMADRTANRLVGYTSFDEESDGNALTPDLQSASDMDNPRGVAQNGDFYVVADVENQSLVGTETRLFIYVKSGNMITLRNTISVDFAVWGIEFVDNDLYAVVDQTSDVAFFADFTGNSADMTLAPTKRVTIEGLDRTHGIAISTEDNLAVLTNIDDATVNNDGGFVVINDFISKMNNTADGGTIPVADQIVVEGANTQMGNPIDCAYDNVTNTVYIAENTNPNGSGNGKILGFNNFENGGNLTPVYNKPLNGASSISYSR